MALTHSLHFSVSRLATLSSNVVVGGAEQDSRVWESQACGKLLACNSGFAWYYPNHHRNKSMASSWDQGSITQRRAAGFTLQTGAQVSIHALGNPSSVKDFTARLSVPQIVLTKTMRTNAGI